MAKCIGVTRANKPCKRLACSGTYCLAHIPTPSDDELETVQRAVNLCRELFKLKINAHPFLLKNVSKEIYYEELVAFNVMIRQVGDLLASVRSIVDRMDHNAQLAKAVSELNTTYAQALWFADDLTIGYGILTEQPQLVD